MTGSRGIPTTIGILGGGQLGRMLALAGLPLGFRFRFLDPKPEPPVRDLGGVVSGDYGDPVALDAFADGVDLVTYEFESVPVEAVERLERRVPVFPPRRALAVTQDRLREKRAFHRLGVPTADFHPVDDLDDLKKGVERLGLPAVLKTRRFGYDGKGQRVLREPGDVDGAWRALGGAPLLLESFVSFRRELSIVSVRGRDGETVSYPLAENCHREGILRVSRAPAPGASPELEREARELAGRMLEDLDYVGVLAIELFDTGEGLLANEMAPRVHNSGHWSQDGAVTSQFENHLRAIAGLPLGSPEPRGFSGMVNLIGNLPERGGILALPGTRLHLYDKEPRPGRKVGHVNVQGATAEELEDKLAALRAVIGEP